MDPLRLKIVVGSTREGRATDWFLPWIVDRAEAHAAFATDMLDLRDWDLPMFQETRETLAAGYSTPTVKRWNETMAAGDAFLLITPEYNHSISGVLKNALDNVFASFALRNKPAGFVSYSVGPVGGARAVEHLALIAIEAEMAALRNAVLLGKVHEGFRDGRPVDPMTDHALTILLDDLAWWGAALRTARADELPPGRLRPLPTA